MKTITIEVPATPAIEALVAALLQQGGVAVRRGGRERRQSAEELLAVRRGGRERRQPAEELLTVGAVADELGINYYTARDWIVARKRIPHCRPSGSVRGGIRVRRSDLEAFKARRAAGKKAGVSVL